MALNNGDRLAVPSVLAPVVISIPCWFDLVKRPCPKFAVDRKLRVLSTLAALAPSGLVLVMDEKGNELVAQNADKPFVPASVTKIVTAWLAMEVLGGDYRFETPFYLDGDRVLYIRGGGDPFLISEELAHHIRLPDRTGIRSQTRTRPNGSKWPVDASPGSAAWLTRIDVVQNCGLPQDDLPDDVRGLRGCASRRRQPGNLHPFE
jgi:D-Ala-D-Ala carboxypeptidase 3 (S13) family